MIQLTKAEQQFFEKEKKKYVANILREVGQDIDTAIKDSNISLIQIHQKLDEIAEYIQPSEYVKLKIQLHKLAHGEKINITQKTLNINVEMKAEEVEELLEELNETN